jgi:hypothetical protein
MKKWIMTAAVLMACGACFIAGQAAGQEGEGGGGGFPVPDWARMGAEQETFKKSVGEWDVNRKMWMAPGQPPMEANETATGRLLYDGRYLEMDYNGTMMGTPFKGRLLMGFDRVDKEYVAVWIDSGSTYISVSRGPEKDGKITFEQNDPDWMTGKKKKTQMVMEWKSDDVYTLSFVEPGPDGKPRTSMMFTYTRRTETE